MNIVIIGAGNVATHIGQALIWAGHPIVQVYSRTELSARTLADKLGCSFTCVLDEVNADADVYLFCVPDTVLCDVSEWLLSSVKRRETTACGRGSEALFLHTAGSMSVNALPFTRRGVLYPMQTFSRQHELDFRQVPLFIESETDEDLLLSLAQSVSDNVRCLSSDGRRRLHLAAVFACNFTNYMYDLAAQVLAGTDIPFDVLLPLIDETARKVHALAPHRAQTGPAVRADRNVIEMHESYLFGDMLEIYKLISRNIYQSHAND